MRRRIGLVAVLAATTALLACSSATPGRDEIIGRIKADPRTQGVPDAVAGCVADWYVKYATSADIKAFVDGSPDARDAEQIAPDQTAKAAMVDCLKGAAGTR